MELLACFCFCFKFLVKPILLTNVLWECMFVCLSYNFFNSTKGLGLGVLQLCWPTIGTVGSHGSRKLKSNIIRSTKALGVGRNLGEGLERRV